MGAGLEWPAHLQSSKEQQEQLCLFFFFFLLVFLVGHCISARGRGASDSGCVYFIISRATIIIPQ
jgi:hypothetical protein